jgi:hypothetical protein
VDSGAILAATADAFLLAGFVKGVIGMGLPTVSIGLLGLLMTPIQAAAILVVPSLVTNILAGCRRRRNIQTCTADVATARRHLHGHFIRRAAATARWQRATVWLGLALAAYARWGWERANSPYPAMRRPGWDC